MAKKRRTKRKAPLSRATPKRRKTTKRRKTGLSSGGTRTLLMNAAKQTLSSAGGGYASAIVNGWIPPTWGKPARIGLILVAGLAGAYFGMPNTTAGFVGGMTAQTFPKGGLNDDSDTKYANQNSLSDLPLFLDEAGNPMVLEEGDDGAGYRYLSEDEIQTLQDEGAFSEYEEV